MRFCRSLPDCLELAGKRFEQLASSTFPEVDGDELIDQLRELADVAAPKAADAFPVSTVLDAALLMESLRQEDSRSFGHVDRVGTSLRGGTRR